MGSPVVLHISWREWMQSLLYYAFVVGSVEDTPIVTYRSPLVLSDAKGNPSFPLLVSWEGEDASPLVPAHQRGHIALAFRHIAQRYALGKDKVVDVRPDTRSFFRPDATLIVEYGQPMIFGRDFPNACMLALYLVSWHDANGGVRPCRGCGTIFLPTTGKQIYCTKRCARGEAMVRFRGKKG